MTIPHYAVIVKTVPVSIVQINNLLPADSEKYTVGLENINDDLHSCLT